MCRKAISQDAGVGGDKMMERTSFPACLSLSYTQLDIVDL